MIIYSCITPGYDKMRDDLLMLPPLDKFKEEVLNAKMCKILPHLYFKDEITIWVDGNIYLSADNLYLIGETLKDFDM